MPRLRVLSLARNCLKKLERLEDVAGTLEELWASYNGISSLDGLQACTKLRVLYLSNNLVRAHDLRLAGSALFSPRPSAQCPPHPHPTTTTATSTQLRDWAELDKLAALPELTEVLFVGNPMYEGIERSAARAQVLRRLPRLAKVDSALITDADRQAALKA